MNNGLSIRKVTALPSVAEPHTIYQVGTSMFLSDSQGNITQLGSNCITGQTTLVAGTKAIAAAGVKTTSVAFLQLVSAAHASTVERAAVCTAGILTITALIAAKTINVSDVAVVNYQIYI